MLNLERFTKNGGSFLEKVSIRKNGQIGFSQGLIKNYKLKHEGQYAILFYDGISRVIGIMFTENNTEDGCIKVQVRETTNKSNGKTNLTAHLSAKSFLEYHNIDYKETETFEPIWSTEHNMLLVYLDKKEATS